MAEWIDLPDLLLRHIFGYLSTSDKLFLSDVCPRWAEAACAAEVWREFTFSEDEYLIDSASLLHPTYIHDRNICMDNVMKQKIVSIIQKFGKYFRDVKIYYRGSNSCQIVNCIAENCLNIKCLKIVRIHGFVNIVKNHENPCKQAVYRIIKQNTRLQALHVKDIDTYDSTLTQHREVVPIGAGHSQNLQKFYFSQSFQTNNLGNMMYLVNLKELAIEPKVLSYSLLYHLAGHALTDLHIVALSKHVEFYNEALQNWQWKKISSQGHNFRVHCHFGVGHEWTEKEIMLKKDMPVKTFKYQKDHLLHYDTLSPLLMNYSSTLEVFIDLSFSMKIYEFAKRDSKYVDINVQILNFVRACPKLKTLIVKEVLLSSTILAMLVTNKNMEIILMEDQLRIDLENILCKRSDLNPPLCEEATQAIKDGCSGISPFLAHVQKMTGNTLKVLKKQDFIALMLEKYIDFM